MRLYRGQWFAVYGAGPELIPGTTWSSEYRARKNHSSTELYGLPATVETTPLSGNQAKYHHSRGFESVSGTECQEHDCFQLTDDY